MGLGRKSGNCGEGWNVPQHSRERSNHRMNADPSELVYAGIGTHDNPVVDVYVTRDLRIVRECCEIADDAIVRHVRVRKKEIAVANPGVAPVLRGTGMDGHVFAKHVVVPDGRRGRLAAVFTILRNIADRGELENAVAHADGGMTGDDDMRANDGCGADFDVGANDRKRADRCVGRDARGRIDERGGMDI